MSKLAARVEGQNRVNAEANRLCVLALAAFRPLVGKKIINANGYLGKTFEHLKPVPGPGIETVYQETSQWAVRYVVRCIANTAGHQKHTFYAEQTFTVGALRDGVLVEVPDVPSATYRTDYTEAKILELRAAFQEARNAMLKAEAALAPFGEYDS